MLLACMLSTKFPAEIYGRLCLGGTRGRKELKMTGEMTGVEVAPALVVVMTSETAEGTVAPTGGAGQLPSGVHDVTHHTAQQALLRMLMLGKALAVCCTATTAIGLLHCSVLLPQLV